MNDVQNSRWFSSLKTQTTTRMYGQGDIVHYQVDNQDELGLVLSGEVEAVSYSENGQQTWIGKFNAGDFICHDALIDITHETYELIACSNVLILIIPTRLVAKVLGGEESFAYALSENLAIQIDQLISRTVRISTLSMKSRICEELIRLSVPIGMEPHKNIIRPNPVFSDLARRLNSTRETVSRTVAELQKSGVLVREPGALVVQNVELLKNAFT